MDGQLVRGHTYNGGVARDNARVHYGDAYYHGNTNVNYYYSCSSSSQPSAGLLTSCGHRVEGTGGELLSLKRKRLSDGVSTKQHLDKEESLELVLSKLGKFSKTIQDQRLGKDARKIVRRIALIINAVKKQAAIQGEDEPVQVDDRIASHDEDDFESIDNCLFVAKRVDINTGIHRIGRTKLVRVVRKRDVVTFGQLEISLSISSFESRDENGTDIVESLASVCLNPRNPSAVSPVYVYIGQRTNHLAANFIHPVVLAYRIIPHGSDVFQFVEDDDLEGLEKFLACGKATLRDCDEYNTCLLTVSRAPILAAAACAQSDPISTPVCPPVQDAASIC
jgi:hypothetical protein